MALALDGTNAALGTKHSAWLFDAGRMAISSYYNGDTDSVAAVLFSMLDFLLVLVRVWCF